MADFHALRHTFIEDERSALARLPELGAKAGENESARATGTDEAIVSR